MTLTEIERALRDLRLSGIAATLNTRVMQAQASQQPFLETLASMLQDEIDRRHSRLSDRRFKHSRLEERLTLVDFDQVCVTNGIRHLLTAPYSPTTTGKVERFHRTLRKEFFGSNDYRFATVADFMQMLGDAVPVLRFYVRDYGLLITINGSEPTEGMPVQAFIAQTR